MALVYHLTAAGKAALSEKGDAADLPLEYRRLLAVMESEGHIHVIRGRLRRFPDRLIDEWLKELEELKMIEAAETRDKVPDITFNGSLVPPVPPLANEDK
ncbi:MAG TPA: hypothetical protein VEX61_07925, partial [Burkholderiales bacterium]|nr:hypothetical protein [Burkholderiales bacterium]